MLAFRPAFWARRLTFLGLDSRGSTAVEFALIMPFLVFLFLGLNELQPAYSVKRKITYVARTVADLTARSGTLTSDQLKTIFGASGTIMRPYDQYAKAQIVVSSVLVTKTGNTYTGNVAWSCGWNLSSGSDDLKTKAPFSTVDVPAKHQNAKSFQLVEVLYPYTPSIGYTISGTMKLKESLDWSVRDSDRVTLVGLLGLPTCPAQT